jgi:hypothetical protein
MPQRCEELQQGCTTLMQELFVFLRFSLGAAGGSAVPLKREAQAVDAVAQTGFCGAVVKHMAQMAPTLAAKNLSPNHTMGEIAFLCHDAVAYFLVKAGPTAMGVKLAFRGE